MDKLLYTKKEVAAALSVCVRTIERLIASGELPYIRLGASTRIRVEDLEVLIEKNAKKRNGS